eukprot:scpid59031/ scgid35382/ Poly(A)-specific ribonuclease PARN-like domain-containing protein 1
MDVTRANFRDLLPVIHQKIDECSFVAVDTEFTGLCGGPDQEYSLFDTPAKRYVKLRKSVQQFIVCQLGITTFTNDHWKNQYTATSFNFYLFPRSFDNIDERFSVQTSSFEFLCDHHFDFNKFAYDGIPYLSCEQEASIRQKRQTSFKDAQAQQACEEQLTEACGFLLVFKHLMQAKKPLLGHNMFMDLLFLYDKFYKPLPVSYDTFKEDIHDLFPVLIDTKHIANQVKRELSHPGGDLVRNTGLDALHTNLTSKACDNTAAMFPSIHLDTESSRYEEAQFHEAGYDSFVAGVVLIRMCHLLARQSMAVEDRATTSWAKICKLIEGHINLINVIRGSVQYLSITGPDPSSCRPTWLELTSRSFLGKLTRDEVVECLEQYDKLDYELQGSNRCIIAAEHAESARRLHNDFADHPLFQLSEYQPSTSPLVYVGFGGAALLAGAAAVYYLKPDYLARLQSLM